MSTLDRYSEKRRRLIDGIASAQEAAYQEMREVLDDGLSVGVSRREADYLLDLLADRDDPLAEALRARFAAPVPPLYIVPERADGHITAGQDADPTTYAFWYAPSTRCRLKHVRLNGLVSGLLRMTRGVR